MQTFLPFPDFEKSAKVLDRQRLGKQRVEALQLLRGQWANHPASKMWRGFEFVLAEYAEIVCLEWVDRGYKDTCREKILEEKKKFSFNGYPYWLGDPRVHDSHKSNLLRKDYKYYVRYFDGPSDVPYFWPTAG